jgi:hypothetical protein
VALLTRALVAAALAASGLAAGCYDPTLRDCTLTCSSPDDCAAGQVCGSDGLCARASLAGTCKALTAPDARPRMIDAAPALVALHVLIAGPGKVAVAPPGVTCQATTDLGSTCDYTVLRDQPVTLTAIATKDDRPFHDWSGACAGQGAICTLVPSTAPLTTKVTFAKGDH